MSKQAIEQFRAKMESDGSVVCNTHFDALLKHPPKIKKMIFKSLAGLFVLPILLVDVAQSSHATTSVVAHQGRSL